jgi:hypothetical protein
MKTDDMHTRLSLLYGYQTGHPHAASLRNTTTTTGTLNYISPTSTTRLGYNLILTVTQLAHLGQSPLRRLESVPQLQNLDLKGLSAKYGGI